MKVLYQRHRTKLLLLVGTTLITAVLVYLIWAPRRNLLDYEKRCRETPDPQGKEKIALQALDFLVHQEVPDSVVQQIDRLVAHENLRLPADTLLFPEITTVMNDSLAGLYEALLADYLPRLDYARRLGTNVTVTANLAVAKGIVAQLDAWLRYDYWAPLMDFLEKADDDQWHRWRAATVAADQSKRALTAAQFALAKHFAVYGFQALADVPDHRLYLDLCLRLQNAIAEGEAVFNLGFALGDWITRASLAAAYYLRATSMEYNLGNQLVLTGRFEEALVKLKDVLRLTQQWRHVRSIVWYHDHAMERISATLYEMGDYSAMLHYLNRFGKVATSTRQKTLYHLQRGLAAKHLGDLQAAEREFNTAIVYGKGDEQNGYAPDPLNVFYAYLDLGNLFLDYHMPEKSLLYYDEARAYGEGIKGSFNSKSWTHCLFHYWLNCAKAFIQNQDMAAARMALEQVQQFVDSPHLRSKYLFAAANLHENMKQFAEAEALLEEARRLCAKNGMVLNEINAILQQAALALQTSTNSTSPEDLAEELEKVIARVRKSGNKRQIVNALALVIDAANQHGRYGQAHRYADLLLHETEALSRLYDEEQRLIFFQHGTYRNVKTAITPDIRLGRIDSAFVKLDYVKARALRRRLTGSMAANEMAPKLQYANLTDLQQQLQPNEAIIDYMVTEDTLYAFLLRQADLRIFRFGFTQRELQAEVDEYLTHLMANDRKKDNYDEERLRQDFLQTVELSHSLYTKLLKGMAEFLKESDRLYIVPDEFLHALPFNTLAVREGLEADFLISAKAVMYLPAASILADQKSGANSSTHIRMLASVDPDMYGAQKISNRLIDLLHEDLLMRTHWGNQVEIEAWLAGGYQAYFFYAHAEANWDDPWQSYIQFPLNQPRQHGKLTYGDIDSINWQQTSLVILAGCETTGNRIYSGAGLSGLQRGFLAGGTQYVLATLWKVDAAQVAFQMSEFLDVWNRSGDAMLALQLMQQRSIAELKRNPYLKYPHPRFWGAYNLTGTTRPSSSSPHYAARS